MVIYWYVNCLLNFQSIRGPLSKKQCNHFAFKICEIRWTMGIHPIRPPINIDHHTLRFVAGAGQIHHIKSAPWTQHTRRTQHAEIWVSALGAQWEEICTRNWIGHDDEMIAWSSLCISNLKALLQHINTVEGFRPITPQGFCRFVFWASKTTGVAASICEDGCTWK